MAHARRKSYASPLKNADVQRWYDNVARSSSVTADVYLRRMGSFCIHFKRTPEDLAILSESELYNMMLDYVTFMEKSGKAGSYIKSTLKAVKSWLSYKRKEVRRRIRINGSEDTPSLRDERIPTNSELKRILLSSDKKARVACVLIAHSGLRIEVLDNYTGNDGLMIRDLPETKIEKDSVDFQLKPVRSIEYYPFQNLTIDFYRKLATHEFNLIIFRIHSSYNYFFSCEKYDEHKYIGEQLLDQIQPWRITGEKDIYFGITDNFVRDCIDGEFANTTIMQMGCDGLLFLNMAKAFREKGAQVFIAWSNTISAGHTDKTTICLLQHLILEKQTIGQAVENAMRDTGPDPEFNFTKLSYYPPESETHEISHLGN